MDYIIAEDGQKYVIEESVNHPTDEIVRRLISCRKALKFTQQDIADATGIKRANIARIESRRNGVSVDSLIKYAESMGYRLNIQLEAVCEDSMRYGNVNIINDVDGNNVVVINDIRFKGKRSIDWDEVEEYLKEYVGKCYQICETSEKIYIGNDFPDEFAHSKDTKVLKGTNAKAKANSAQAVGQLIQIATNKGYSPDYNSKHKDRAKYGWYRYDSRFALPVYDELGELQKYNIFSVRMLVRHDSDGKMYLYDILRTKKETSKPL